MSGKSAKETWQEEFRRCIGHQYFDLLSSPNEINHLDYFRFCCPRRVDRETYHQHWVTAILPRFLVSSFQQVSDQSKRLKKEWLEQAQQTNDFWDMVAEEDARVAEEDARVAEVKAKTLERQLDRKHLLSLQTNAVEQLDTEFQRITKKVKSGLDRDDAVIPQGTNNAIAPQDTNNPIAPQDANNVIASQDVNDIIAPEDTNSFEETSDTPTSAIPAAVVAFQDVDSQSSITPPLYSSQVFGAHLLSSDPADLSFDGNDGEDLSHSRYFTWDFLDGGGRMDSAVDAYWKPGGMDVGRELMASRDAIVSNNGGLVEPFEKLLVNFVFLIEANFQNGGLQGMVEDNMWASMCEEVKDLVPVLSREVMSEAHDWGHHVAHNTPSAVKQLLNASPPVDGNVASIVDKMLSVKILWSTRPRNEDTFVKQMLGPFLETYFKDLDFTESDWTPSQAETVGGVGVGRLEPDFSVITEIQNQLLSVFLLEAKVKGGERAQIWDDKTKLGQEMRLALDSILKLQPEGEVSTVGLLVREPYLDFYSMKVRAEATYIMHRFASAFVPKDALSCAVLLFQLMPIFDHVKAKVQSTVAEIRKVKVRPSPHPKVPLSWLRPSFNKPQLVPVKDGA